MKKILFLVAGAIGFILGSKIGHGPYQQLEGQVRKVTGRPEVQHVVDQAKGAATDQVDHLAHKVGEKLPSHDADTSGTAGEAPAPQSTGTEPSGY